MKTAAIYSLVPKDLIKGLLVAVLTAVMTGLTTSLNSGAMPTMADAKVIGLAAISAGVAYLTKNFLTNSEDKFLTKEPTDAPKA